MKQVLFTVLFILSAHSFACGEVSELEPGIITNQNEISLINEVSGDQDLSCKYGDLTLDAKVVVTAQARCLNGPVESEVRFNGASQGQMINSIEVEGDVYTLRIVELTGLSMFGFEYNEVAITCVKAD